MVSPGCTELESGLIVSVPHFLHLGHLLPDELLNLNERINE